MKNMTVSVSTDKKTLFVDYLSEDLFKSIGRVILSNKENLCKVLYVNNEENK